MLLLFKSCNGSECVPFEWPAKMFGSDGGGTNLSNFDASFGESVFIDWGSLLGDSIGEQIE